MTFLQALYGSQYQEIKQRGGDASKGRINGNMFLTAFILLLIIDLIAFIVKISSSGSVSFLNNMLNNFNVVSGKLTGKLLAVPLFIVVYIIVSKTVGTIENYKIITDEFVKLPDDIKKKANAKLLIPFFILLTLLIVLIIFS